MKRNLLRFRGNYVRQHGCGLCKVADHEITHAQQLPYPDVFQISFHRLLQSRNRLLVSFGLVISETEVVADSGMLWVPLRREGKLCRCLAEVLLFSAQNAETVVRRRENLRVVTLVVLQVCRSPRVNR